MEPGRSKWQRKCERTWNSSSLMRLFPPTPSPPRRVGMAGTGAMTSAASLSFHLRPARPPAERTCQRRRGSRSRRAMKQHRQREPLRGPRTNRVPSWPPPNGRPLSCRRAQAYLCPRRARPPAWLKPAAGSFSGLLGGGLGIPGELACRIAVAAKERGSGRRPALRGPQDELRPTLWTLRARLMSFLERPQVFALGQLRICSMPRELCHDAIDLLFGESPRAEPLDVSTQA